MKRRRMLHWALRGAAALALLYAIVAGALYWAMSQSPDRFGRIMARIPKPLFIVMAVMPFEPMWNSAREGSLRVGELAPDFALSVVEPRGPAGGEDEGRRVQLSSFRGSKPVVLVFGSYT